MVTETTVAWRTLVAAINARHGTQFTLGPRYDLGEQSAYILTDAVGTRYVLKRGGAAAMPHFVAVSQMTAGLQRDGYPAPRYHFVGEVADTAYAVLDALPGELMTMPPMTLIPQLFALNSLQAGRADARARDWPAMLIETVLSSGDGYGEFATLRSHSDATASLLNRCQDAARAAEGVSCIAGDIVHHDFNPANLLLSEGRITGVTDWDAARVGDCAFDLATLLVFTYDAPPARQVFGRHLRQRLDPRIAALYIAYVIVRRLDWVIRSCDPATISRAVATARAVSEDFLPPA